MKHFQNIAQHFQNNWNNRKINKVLQKPDEIDKSESNDHEMTLVIKKRMRHVIKLAKI